MLEQDGSVWTAGVNTFGQLGIDMMSYAMVTHFVKVLQDGAEAVAAGDEYSIVLKLDGSVWCTGRNIHGQLGDGSSTDRDSFVQVIPSHAKTVTAGAKHSLVVMRDGSMWATGFNQHGQLGDGSTTDKTSFLKVIPSDAKTAAAGSHHSMVLKQDGSVWFAGNNDYGQLGDGPADLKSSFVQLIVSGVEAIAAGSYHSVVRSEDGSVWATGGNDFGQVGDGSEDLKKNSFVHVISGGCETIAAGGDHSLVLMQDGSVWATGKNDYFQLGAWGKESRRIFGEVIAGCASPRESAVTTPCVKIVAAGNWNSMLLMDDGSLWATGRNDYGQLGVGSTVDSNTFVRVVLHHDGVWCYGSMDFKDLRYILPLDLSVCESRFLRELRLNSSTMIKISSLHMPLPCAYVHAHVLCQPLVKRSTPPDNCVCEYAKGNGQHYDYCVGSNCRWGLPAVLGCGVDVIWLPYH